jgi:magnesium transporter
MKEISFRKLKWLNIEQVDDTVLNTLKQKYNFHHLDLEDIQTDAQTPKLDVYKNYIFTILQFPYWDQKTKRVIPYQIDFFAGEGFLITIQHHTSREVSDQFKRWMKSRKAKKDWMTKDSGYLLYSVIEALFQKSRPMLNSLGRQIYTLEQEIFDEHEDVDLIRELATHRRNILAFRRIIDPQRYLMGNLSHIRKPFLNEDTSLYFDDINDYLSKLWAIIDSYRDTIQGLHVTVESLINQKTNRVIGALTVISVALLPLTLFAGIYGMNVALPFDDHPWMIWAIFGILAFTIVVLILLMRKKRWI